MNRARRRLEERGDQALALLRWQLEARLGLHAKTPAFDGEPRFALLTVNRSTTHYLKLMLLTLCEQSALATVRPIVVCDNDSRDGGPAFLRQLAARSDRIVLCENRFGKSHARGMRVAIAALRRHDAALAERQRANIWLFCDTDVVFRDPATLATLGARMAAEGAAVAGELRHGLYPFPEAQASFVAVRADWYTRPEVLPWVNHGAPSYWMQRSVWQAQGHVLDFPSNQGGYILHRGRAAVARARQFAPWSSYATAPTTEPHYMGVPGGAALWAEIEARHAPLLTPTAEPALLDLLVERLKRNGA